MVFYDVLCIKSILCFLLSERTSRVSPVIFLKLCPVKSFLTRKNAVSQTRGSQNSGQSPPKMFAVEGFPKGVDWILWNICKSLYWGQIRAVESDKSDESKSLKKSKSRKKSEKLDMIFYQTFGKKVPH